MTFIELKNPKTEKYLNLVGKIKTTTFPWSYFEDVLINKSHNEQKIPWYSHNVLNRCASINQNSCIKSIYYQNFKEVLLEIFNFNSICIKRFYRINVNATHIFSDLIAPIHVDHTFKHQQLIIYLNNLKSKCPTYLFKQKWKDGDLNAYPPTTLEEGLNNFDIGAIIQPEENKIISFDGLTYHSYEFPKNVNERRLCIVVTYCPL